MTYAYSGGRRIPDTISYANRLIQFRYEERFDNSSGYSHLSPFSSAKRLAGITATAEHSTNTYDIVYSDDPEEVSLPVTLKKGMESRFGSASFSDINFSYTPTGNPVKSKSARFPSGRSLGLFISRQNLKPDETYRVTLNEERTKLLYKIVPTKTNFGECKFVDE